MLIKFKLQITTLSKYYLAAFIIGIVIRYLLILHTGPGPQHAMFPGMDEINYRELAENIVDFDTYGAWAEGFFTKSTRAPGYPWLLAGAYRLTNNWKWTPSLLNLLLDSLNIILIYSLAKSMYNRKTGVYTSILYAFFGPVFLYLAMSTPEIYTVFLLLLSCCCLQMTDRYYIIAAPFMAVFYALLIHTRPAFLVITPFLAVCIFLRLTSDKPLLRFMKAIVPILLIAILCFPWLYRNYKEHNAIVPVCTIACWHLFSSAHNKDSLSTNTITNYIYAPERKGFGEGDYFKEGLTLSRQKFFDAPFSSLGIGALRVLYNWSFPGPFYRCLLPKAYITPIYLTDSFFIVLPDFEGFIYLSIITILISALLLGKNWMRHAFLWFYQSRSIIVLLGAYVIVHIISIPLTQYRFVIEPLIIVLIMGFIFSDFDSLRSTQESEMTTFSKTFVYAVGILLFFFLLIPFIPTSGPTFINYPANLETQTVNTLQSLREEQWRNHGSIPFGQQATFCGRIKYISPDLHYYPDLAKASPSPDSVVAKLYVNDLSPQSPMGLSDIKLNFTGDVIPKANTFIKVTGSLSTGAYKDFILDVDSWETIKQQ